MEFLTLFSVNQLILISLIFIWTGFVRSGIGFGGAALGLPLLLLVDDNPLVFLPIIGSHLLFFTFLTLSSRNKNINWLVAFKVLLVILIPKIAGLIGLFNLPNYWLVMAVFSITLFYGITWVLNYTIKSKSKFVDGVLLALGGYVSGTSLTGAPLIAAVVSRYVKKTELRETLFVLWIILVILKMSAFVVYDVDLQWQLSLFLMPFVGIGHYIGLKAHDHLVNSDSDLFHRFLGLSLIVVSLAGLFKYISDNH